MKYFNFSLFIFAVVISSFANGKDKPIVIRLDAEKAMINSGSAGIVEDNRLTNHKGMTLRPGVAAATDGERADPDLVFPVKVPAGRYVMSTFAVTDEEGAELMKKATSKYESLYIKIRIDDQRPTKRVVYVPWDIPRQESGKFNFNGDDQKLKIWLPRGIRLEYVQLSGYVPPTIPALAGNYRPGILPPATHPRLWVNQQSLPKVKAQLEAGENRTAWMKVKDSALTPFVFEFRQDEEMPYHAGLERAAETKAFYYLMAGDKKVGREAVSLITNYLSLVEFGNLLDITREIGRAIYTASVVYDWCYELLTPGEKEILYHNLMRLAENMEIGWPPFKQSVITGHGNEAQLNRDLLAMSIAIYNEDPLPYQYCSYRVLEELVPMRNWQYQSPRHNQGINYGIYRIGWELHAAWLFYRMTGQPVFDENLKDVSRFWLYMRLPDGQMLRDGDCTIGPPGDYWGNSQTMFLFYTYAHDPVIKAEFERQGGLPGNPVLFLLLNDPALKAEPSLGSLPLTIDFGPVVGGMIARTGWHMGMNSNDVVAEIKGGGYHFGNHQHSDAGSIQIYYRGIQMGDLGLYGFYGTPYDFNFNKRSIAHSMMLARDPEEKFGNTGSNDGGTRFNQRHPASPKAAQTDPWFCNGKVVSADFGPSKLHPSFSYFAVDLVGAYSSKIKAYTRGLCFLNLDRDDIPAALILTDDMTTVDPEYKKYWQINTLNMPEITSKRVILKNEQKGLIGRTHVEMLIPAEAERDVNVLSDAEAHSSFEFKYDIPGRIKDKNPPEANGHRIMISPKTANNRDRFLTVFQLAAGDTEPLPVTWYETQVSYVVLLADRVVSMSKSTDLIGTSYTLKIPSEGEYQVILAGMKPGDWNVAGKDGKIKFNTIVTEGENSVFFQATKGEYIISPGWIAGTKRFRIPE
jgi:heparin/heparan-sulfate lyase